jgi:hypothetical protein
VTVTGVRMMGNLLNQYCIRCCSNSSAIVRAPD